MGICEDCKEEFEDELLNEKGRCEECQKKKNNELKLKKIKLSIASSYPIVSGSETKGTKNEPEK